MAIFPRRRAPSRLVAASLPGNAPQILHRRYHGPRRSRSTGGTPAGVTDGGGEADMPHASSRRSGRLSGGSLGRSGLDIMAVLLASRPEWVIICWHRLGRDEFPQFVG
jgi:hypothetical protein